MLSTLAPPLDPGGLSLSAGFFFQVADLWGFSRETKRVWMCLKSPGEDPKTALWKKKKKSSHWDWNLFSHACQRQLSDPDCNLSPGLRSSFHLCTGWLSVSQAFQACVWRQGLNWRHMWLTICRDTKAKQWYFVELIILPECSSFALWPRFSRLLKRDWFNLSSILLHFLISFSDFLILWHSTLNYSLLHTLKTSICSTSGKPTKHVNVLVYSMIKHNHSLLWRKPPFGLISGIVTCMFDKLDSGKLWEKMGRKLVILTLALHPFFGTLFGAEFKGLLT